MDTDHITNDNLMSTDFAKAEKARFLQSQTRRQRSQAVLLAPGLSAHGVWMTDVSEMDRRSVKAQLAGRGDCGLVAIELPAPSLAHAARLTGRHDVHISRAPSRSPGLN